MKDTLESVVRRAVAHHVGVDFHEVRVCHRLSRDLALQPLDVVVIALGLEESESIELPIERLDTIETVGELADLVGLVLATASHRRAS